MKIHLGYAVGTGEPVEIPLKHMCVTGQTQESGKTTTLEALISRAGRTAVTFVTKRGERAFQTGLTNRLRPYFRADRADWVYVSSLIDATMAEKNRFIRSWLMRVCRGTRTLAEVLDNVRGAKAQARGLPESVYTEIEGYLELVVPQIEALGPPHPLVLGEDLLNVMDLSALSPEMQALCIRATLDAVHTSFQDVTLVIPEAWEFLPEGRNSPVKAAAERLIRKGAALGNYVWIDSQDLAGVWKTVVRACAVALVGVQREANEIKRTLANIPAGVAKPKAADIAQLALGQFYACWGKHAVKTYVQPVTMAATTAQHIARSEDQIQALFRATTEALVETTLEDETVTQQEAAELREENARLRAELDRTLAELRMLKSVQPIPVLEKPAPTKRGGSDRPSNLAAAAAGPAVVGVEAIVQAVLVAIEKQPRLLKLALTLPEIEVQTALEPVTIDGTSAMGRTAKLIKDGFFDEVRTANGAWTELKRFGFAGAAARIYEACDKLVGMGYLTKEDSGYQSVAAMKKHIRTAA